MVNMKKKILKDLIITLELYLTNYSSILKAVTCLKDMLSDLKFK